MGMLSQDMCIRERCIAAIITIAITIAAVITEVRTRCRKYEQDSLAEWSKALASGASPQGRGHEPHSRHFCCAVMVESLLASVVHSIRSIRDTRGSFSAEGWVGLRTQV